MTDITKKMSAKKQTITFSRTDEYVLDFDEWYGYKMYEFKSEADALKQWEAMCEHADDIVEVESDESFEWRQVEDACDAIQEEYKTDAYDEEMTATIVKAEEQFALLGVGFHKNHECDSDCGYEDEENYVFYHAAGADDLRRGERSVYLGLSFDEETKPKVRAMIAAHSDMLYWSGEDDDKIYLTCDAGEMAKHLKAVEELRQRLAKDAAMDATRKEKIEKRAELKRQLAELEKEL